MARAYAYAAGDGPEPREFDALKAIRMFGAEAVFGRPLGVGEIKRMLTVEAIVRSQDERSKAKDGWAAWDRDHPEMAALLNRALRYHENAAVG